MRKIINIVRNETIIMYDMVNLIMLKLITIPYFLLYFLTILMKTKTGLFLFVLFNKFDLI